MIPCRPGALIARVSAPDHRDGSPPGGEAALPGSAIDAEGWLAELLAEGAEARGAAARPIVQAAPNDPPEVLALLEARARRRLRLNRRGVEHGTWYELEAPTGPADPRAGSTPRAGESADPDLVTRFRADRPLILRGAVSPGAHGDEGLALGEALATGSLPLGQLPPGIAPLLSSDARPDPPRDRARWTTRSEGCALELWAKASLLSDHEDERSWRLRISAGREPEDEGCRDDAVHGEVTRLAEALLPGAARIHGTRPIRELVATCVDGEPLFTQSIGYWNAPGGGALLHHDAFDERVEGGQRGVLYTQLAGSTAWLAVSAHELGHEVQAALRTLLTEGEPLGDLERDRAWALASDPEQVLAELALPGCGALGWLVHGGEEFTGRLVDSGHAFVLDAGDAVVLPNHGLTATCFHSVFCASDGPTYAVSSAIRRPGPPPEPVLETVRIGRRRRTRRRSRRRGR